MEVRINGKINCFSFDNNTVYVIEIVGIDIIILLEIISKEFYEQRFYENYFCRRP